MSDSYGGDSKNTLYCSFCFQSQHDVKMLIAGPAAVFICDECVALCNQWIARTPPPAGSRPVAVEDLPTERLIARLGPIEQTVQGRASQLQCVIDILRKREVSWGVIGAALGISRQSAWERFS